MWLSFMLILHIVTLEFFRVWFWNKYNNKEIRVLLEFCYFAILYLKQKIHKTYFSLVFGGLSAKDQFA